MGLQKSALHRSAIAAGHEHDRASDRIHTAAKPRSRFDLHTRGTRDVTVVTAQGELDALTAPRFHGALDDALSFTSLALIVDLCRLQFLSSAGLAALQDANQIAGRTKQFSVVAEGPATSRPIAMIGLDRKLNLYRTLDDALSDIRR